jgi:hypothetical protein
MCRSHGFETLHRIIPCNCSRYRDSSRASSSYEVSGTLYGSHAVTHNRLVHHAHSFR